MRTREQSLKEFLSVMDGLINSKYLFAGSKIFDVLKTINSSKILSDTFEYFVDGFDFEGILSDALIENEEGRFFILPEKNTDAITLVYLLLREINNKNAQLTDLLDYFNGSKNYDIAFKNFANDVLIPFRNYTYEIGVSLIGKTASEFTQISEETQGETISENASTEQEDKPTLNPNTTLLRLLDLDRLSIKQSRLKNEEKEELLYVLDIFLSEIKGGDTDKVRLSYLAYYYALRPFRKLPTNVKEITEILMQEKVI
mgnify:CR=1 FL=1